MSRLRLEPALISGAVVAILNAIVLLGWVDLSADQIAGINTALAAVVAVFVRQQVTPTGETLSH